MGFRFIKKLIAFDIGIHLKTYTLLARLLFAVLLGWMSLWTTTSLAQQRAPWVRPSAANLRAAEVAMVDVRAKVMGRHATTQVDIVLHNPNAVVIEAAFEFPLREGQTVTGFSLENEDHSGFLKAAPVEKAKGQAVFEQIVREGADPGLLEKTAGNHFKLRVYPLSAQRYRTVKLEISEFLVPDKTGLLTYQAPLKLQDAQPKKFSFTLDVEGIAPKNVKLSDGLQSAQLKAQQNGINLGFYPDKIPRKGEFAVSWKSPNQLFTDTGTMDGEHYFRAQVPLSLTTAARKAPNPVTIVWDASGSGAQRDHGRELAFLDATFKAIGNTKVYLIVTHVEAQSPREFEVKQGRWDDLREVLEKMPYDGASNPAAWNATVPVPRNLTKEELAGFAKLTLLFSDGIGNWGATPEPNKAHPLYAISAVAGANSSGLRALAEATGGRYIDLLQGSVAQAVAQLSVAQARLIRMSADGADKLVSASTFAEGGFIQIAGHFTKSHANVLFEFEMPSGAIIQRSIEVKAPATAKGEFKPLVAQQWAEMTITALEANASEHRSEILRLGSEFGVVSSRTSLIILERLSDYLRFNIMPSDPIWREEYKQQVKNKEAQKAAEQSLHLDNLVQRFNAKAAWWEKDFPKGEKPIPAKISNDSHPAMAMSAAPALMAPPPPRPAPAVVKSSAAAPSPQTPLVEAKQKTIVINVQKQEMTAPYATRLREASDDKRYAIYLDEKPSYAHSSAFYLDAAEIFFEKGQKKIGLRVLSNLAEISFEERSLLRILAYRLQQAGLFEEAILLFKQVRDLAPNEPQSWRDLGLAYAANGQAQKAIDALWATASRKWDWRFADADLIALGELNAIAARTPGLNLSRVDSRLLRHLPVDLRVVMTWDADSTDIDLWVKDPNQEDAYYGHQLTYQGGRMSRDFVAGYGPEEYLLKVAKPGRYEVRGKFYGSRQQRFSPYTTVMLRFVTGFGQANQAEQSVIMRLPEKGNEVFVGSFEVK